jgi:hypothetical protein
MRETPRITDEQFQELRQMYLDGVSRDDIAKHFGCSVGAIFDRNREQRLGKDGRPKGRLIHPGCRFLERRQGAGGGRRPGDLYLAEGIVSPEEAEERRAAVFASWDPETRERRRGAGRLDDDDRKQRGRSSWAVEPVKGFAIPRRLDTRPRGNW